MDELHFIRPLWLLALPAAPLLAWHLWRRLKAGERWREVCDPALLPHLLVAPHGARRAWPFWLLTFGLMLAVSALAGPAWERVRDPVYRTSNARVLVLDLSRSMDAGDILPSRLVRARFKAVDILRRSRDRPVGMVVFAGDGFIVTPLTHDANTIVNLLPAVDTSIVPVQGSRADLGLEQAEQLLVRGGADGGEVLLFSDGVKGERAREVAARLRDNGFRVSVLAVGTPGGAPIPLPEGGFLKDMSGAIVVPGTSYEALGEVARAGGGEFTPMTNDETDIERLIGLGDTPRPWEITTEAVERTSEVWRDGGPWLTLPLLVLAALAFRRGWLLAVPLAALTLQAPPAAALGWDDLWWRADQQAAHALAADDVERAATVSRAPAWRGVALYRGGLYPDAAQAFADADGADAHYNRGNALARAGRLERAIAAYDVALARDPDHEDAAFNRDLVSRLLREQQQSGDGQGESSQQTDRAGGGSPAGGEATRGTPRGAPSAPTADGEPEDDAARRDSASPFAAGAERRQGDGSLTREEQQAIEQWLRRVPDDPGGLLRNKFQRQYQQRDNLPDARSDAW